MTNDRHDGGGSCCMCNTCHEARKILGIPVVVTKALPDGTILLASSKDNYVYATNIGKSKNKENGLTS